MVAALANDHLQRCLGARVSYPSTSIFQLFATMVRQFPGKTALTLAGQNLTYQALDDSASSLADRLDRSGVKDGIHALVMNASLGLVVAMLATMRRGAAFVPIDPAWPQERLDTLLAELDPVTVLTDADVDLDPSTSMPATTLGRQGVARPSVEHAPDDPLYGYYTSGSTGRPKCALNVHRGLLNRFLYMTKRYGGRPDEVVLQNSKHVFDSALWQLLWPLTNGAHVVMPERRSPMDFPGLVALIDHHHVTMTDFVPSIFNPLVAYLVDEPTRVANLRSLRHVLVGGEEMNGNAVQQFKKLLPHVSVTNTYGATEASIGMLFHEVHESDGDRIPLGRPIDNTFAIVLDGDRAIMPVGETGELYIGGDCLGSGYANDERGTRSRFVPNPFPSLPGRLLYRTGDRAFQDQGGMFHWVGRDDQQVKVNGVRLEIGEVERALMRHVSVLDARVVVEQGPSDTKALAAYIVSHRRLSSEEIRDHARRVLPREMVPARFQVVDALPLTDNGKLDRLRLGNCGSPSPPGAGGRSQLDVGRVGAILQQVLGAETWEPDLNFFDAGGDSLSAMEAVDALDAAFALELPVGILYECPTATALLGVIHTSGPACSGTRPDPHPAPGISTITPADGWRVALDDDIRGRRTLQHATLNQVLLTGATGFVGSHIGAELLRSTNSTLYCLIRDTGRSAGRRLRESWTRYGLWEPAMASRIVVVTGDLSRHDMSVDAAAYQSLASDIDTIFHCGAMVDFRHGYDQLKSTNVEGTARILRLSVTGNEKTVHHMSTLSVFSGSTELGQEIDEDTALSSVAPSGGYNQSKWMAERLIATAKERGVPVNVYRLGEVMPHSRSGVANPRSAFYLLTKACIALGRFPCINLSMDYSPVDWVTSHILDHAVARHREPGAFHLYHPADFDYRQFMEVLARAGFSLQPCDVDDWYGALQSAARQTGAAAVLRSLSLLLDGSRRARDIVDHLFVDPGRFSQDRTVRLSAPGALDRSEVEGEAVANFVARLQEETNMRDRSASSEVFAGGGTGV